MHDMTDWPQPPPAPLHLDGTPHWLGVAAPPTMLHQYHHIILEEGL